jgi:two-component system chemotaxis response regulator CheB
MPERIVVIGGSAGAVEAVAEIVGGLPAGFPAAVFVVIHFPAESISVLPRILARRGQLPAVHATDGAAIEAGRIYIARPGFHLLINRGQMRVVRGPKENGHRPAVDPLFRTAARAYGPDAIGVIISGNLDDGSAGLRRLKNLGGVAIVQDPETALYAGMPTNAIEYANVDHVVPVTGIAGLLIGLAAAPNGGTMPEELDSRAAENDVVMADRSHRDGVPSTQTCPECHGTLWEQEDGELTRFRCRVGHAFSAETLVDQQAAYLEISLWTALRALEEHAALARRMAAKAADRSLSHSAASFTERAIDAEHHAAVIRGVLTSGADITPAEAARA